MDLSLFFIEYKDIRDLIINNFLTPLSFINLRQVCRKFYELFTIELKQGWAMRSLKRHFNFLFPGKFDSICRNLRDTNSIMTGRFLGDWLEGKSRCGSTSIIIHRLIPERTGFFDALIPTAEKKPTERKYDSGTNGIIISYETMLKTPKKTVVSHVNLFVPHVRFSGATVKFGGNAVSFGKKITKAILPKYLTEANGLHNILFDGNTIHIVDIDPTNSNKRKRLYLQSFLCIFQSSL